MYLSYHEHTEVYRGLCNKQSRRAIARSLKRAPSSIAREVRRNSDEIGYLNPLDGYRRQQNKRGKKQSKITLNAELQVYIVEKLKLKSVTFDNGSEFTRHEALKDALNDTYFCDPGAPWQKGSIEHFNGMLRYRIPFNTPPKEITQELLDSVAYELNHMPRESLNFLTPCEVFSQSYNQRCCNVKTSPNGGRSPGRRQRPLHDKQKKIGVAFYP